MKLKNISCTVFILFTIITFSTICFPQNAGRIIGKVVDAQSNEPLPGTLIKVQKTQFITMADKNGEFKISGLKSGNYLIESILATYPRFLISAMIPAKGDTTITIRLSQTSATSDIFEIGGIKVEAERELMPLDHVATTRISSGEVENLQASSLGDILQIVPGLEKSNRLGLDHAIQANIRGDHNDAKGAFGTKIIMDEAPISNNANMQEHAATAVTSGQGIDLRTIPADNIESIEIIRGVPSAKYGDLTSGIIKVKSKSGVASPRLKMKSNPNTTEANFGTGFKIGENILNINLNYGYSEKELRKNGDEYHRLNGTLIAQRNFIDNRLPLKYKFFATRAIDEEKATDVRKRGSYNRGYTINNDLWSEYSPNNLEMYKASIYVHYTRKNSYRQKIVEADPNWYIGWWRMIGDEIAIGGRLEANRKMIFSSSVHEFMAGLEVQYDNNFGEGFIIDSTESFYGLDSPIRSYTFDEVPGMTQVALYLEDKFTGKLCKEFTLVLGLRYDLFKPKSMNFDGLWNSKDFIYSQHGSFLSPRLGWMIYLTPTTQLRGGFGKAAKIPSMDYIFEPRESVLHKLQYYSYDESNFNLKGYYIKEVKLGLDQKIFNWASISAEGYYSWREKEPETRNYPFFYEINPDTFWVPTYSRYENIGWQKQKGFEFTLRTKSYKDFSMTINATYRFTRNGEDILKYNSNPDPIDTDGDGITDSYDPVWQDQGSDWKEKWIIDYALEYRAKTLGLWFQFVAQQIPFYQKQDENQYEKGIFANYIEEYPNNWVFNFRLSKSLWWNSEVSLYVNNFLDDRSVYEQPWERQYYPDTSTWGWKYYTTRNNPIFWGFEFSTKFDF